MSILRDSPHLTDHDDAAVDDYRAVCAWAVASIVLGLLAPLALIDVWLSLVPLAGMVVATVALVRIAVLAPALTGRNAALAGLFLSVLCASAAATEQVAYWRAIDGEARRFAEAWFALLAKGQPYRAHQLTLAPQDRQALNADLGESYREVESPRREELEGYVNQPVVRRLLTLGEGARAQYHATEASGRDARSIGVRQLYAVTCDDVDRGKTTFFVRLTMQRLPLEHGQAAWRMLNVESAVEP